MLIEIKKLRGLREPRADVINQLAADMAVKGQLTQILLHDNNVIADGTQRVYAAMKLGWSTIDARYFDWLVY